MQFFIFSDPFVTSSYLAYYTFCISPIFTGRMADRMHGAPNLDALFITELENNEVSGSVIEFDDGKICYFVIFFRWASYMSIGRNRCPTGGFNITPMGWAPRTTCQLVKI